MELLEKIIGYLSLAGSFGPTIDGTQVPIIVIALLGTGLFLTVRLGFIQFRRIGHGFAVATGKYDDPNETGDVSHFQALTTALSATVGIGNIAGVALAVHWGGPGAIFWMWITAIFGMAVKYSEVTLAQKYRQVENAEGGGKDWAGTVSGGPMYYIEKGLGKSWKPVAVFFAFALMITSFLTGNAVQANTVADQMQATFGIEVWITGIVAALIVGGVILGGIKRIGKVTSILAPLMAGIYVLGAIAILIGYYDQILPAFGTIFSEAFNPTAGVAGTGVGAVLVTMLIGVQRGLFSNEAGQGSAPIAHAAAKTEEPVSEGVVALLEPFIDTLVICSMTGLVIIATGVWSDTTYTELDLGSGDISYVETAPDGAISKTDDIPTELVIVDGYPAGEGAVFAWHEVAVERFYTDADLTTPFTGVITTATGEHDGTATDTSNVSFASLHGNAVESGAPLTTLAFSRGFEEKFGLGWLGGGIVVFSVLLFGLSTAISWSYYGDRCANYLWGQKAILPYKAVYIVMHLIGATVPLATIWALGDAALSLVTFPNLIALLMLSGGVVKMTNSYFERKPWG